MYLIKYLREYAVIKVFTLILFIKFFSFISLIDFSGFKPLNLSCNIPIQFITKSNLMLCSLNL